MYTKTNIDDGHTYSTYILCKCTLQWGNFNIIKFYFYELCSHNIMCIIVLYTHTCTLMVCLCASKKWKFQNCFGIEKQIGIGHRNNAHIFKLVVFLPYILHTQQWCGHCLLVGRAKQLQLLILGKWSLYIPKTEHAYYTCRKISIINNMYFQ